MLHTASSGGFLITPNVGLMVWTLVLFVLSMVVLARLAFPRITEALDKRQHAIEDSIDHAERIRNEADELLVEYRERLHEARQHAAERDVLDPVREQLGQFADALREERQLAVFFFSPYFSTQEKQDGLRRMLDGPDEIFMNFLEALTERHRMPVIFRIRQRFDALW